MAVEDGATLGRLLGLFSHHQRPTSFLPSLLELYQEIRKKRAATTVKTADGHRKLYHMPDGPQQEERDRLYATHDWWDEVPHFRGRMETYYTGVSCMGMIRWELLMRLFGGGHNLKQEWCSIDSAKCIF